MRYLFVSGCILLFGPGCFAQEMFDRETKERDSVLKEWKRVDDSITVEWNKSVAIIMNSPQFSENEKKELTNYCTAYQFRTEATKYWLTVPMIPLCTGNRIMRAK